LFAGGATIAPGPYRKKTHAWGQHPELHDDALGRADLAPRRRF
jgi:hypothetical protein